MNAQLYIYSETLIADRLGISKTDLVTVRRRRLREDEDWRIVGREVALTALGVKKLWRSIGATREALDLASCLCKKNGAARECPPIQLGDRFAPIPQMMIVSKVCPNPMVILVLDEHRRTNSVWVGRNANFSIGMKIDVVPHAQMPGFWRMLGTMPRRKYSPDEWTRRQRAGLQG